MSERRTKFVIGSRESELAMRQSRHVQRLLQDAFPDFTFEIQTSVSSGDKDMSKPLHELASANPGLFTKELEVRHTADIRISCTGGGCTQAMCVHAERPGTAARNLSRTLLSQ
jgi:porphobilinogen deaminase